MDRTIMVTAALLLVLGSAACRTPEEKVGPSPPVEPQSQPVLVVPKPDTVSPTPTPAPVPVAPPSDENEGRQRRGVREEDEGSESEGEIRLARLERRVVELETLVAGMQERVERLQAKPPLPHLEKAKSDLDDMVADFVGALELLALSKPSAEEER